jgi:hypothetical protein
MKKGSRWGVIEPRKFSHGGLKLDITGARKFSHKKLMIDAKNLLLIKFYTEE